MAGTLNFFNNPRFVLICHVKALIFLRTTPYHFGGFVGLVSWEQVPVEERVSSALNLRGLPSSSLFIALFLDLSESYLTLSFLPAALPTGTRHSDDYGAMLFSSPRGRK